MDEPERQPAGLANLQLVLELRQGAPEFLGARDQRGDPFPLVHESVAFRARVEGEPEDADRVPLARPEKRGRHGQVVVDAGEGDRLVDALAPHGRRGLGWRAPVGDRPRRPPEHVPDLLLGEACDDRRPQHDEERPRLLSVWIVRGIEHLLRRDALEHVEEVERAPHRRVEEDPRMSTKGLREAGQVGDAGVRDDQLRLRIGLDELLEVLGDRRKPSPAVNEDWHASLGCEREDGSQAVVVEVEPLRAGMELDPSRPAIEAPRRLLDRLLGEIESREGDENAAGLFRRLERAVVRRPEGRLAIGLVEAERKRVTDSIALQEGEQIVERCDEAVDVAADVNVRVEELGAFGEQRGDLVVIHLDERACSLQGVIHRVWNLPQVAFLAVADVLIFADTIRSPELRHEVPVPMPDPLIYAERNGDRYVFVGSLEIPRIDGHDGLVVVPNEELGVDELFSNGIPWHDAERELVLRACRKIGLEDAVTPREFPLDAADYLRANGISLRADGSLFDERRRAKNESELAGIRRAQAAAERAMHAIRARLREGGDLTSEDLQAEALRSFSESGVIAPDMLIVSHGEQTAVGHEPGHGAIREGEPVIADLYPQDSVSGCYADMTRTFCLGEPPEELTRYHGLVKEALDRAVEAVRPGVTGKELHQMTCELFQEHGFLTQLNKDPSKPLEDGFFHSLGHGVGLEVHELPSLGRSGEELVPGDVLAVEPGLYRKGFGGCRLEDLVRVTDDGAEILTDFPYDLS